ncbi:MAG: FtsX-like permease family protein [Bacteroidales bacterium]|nr:FtsX-like permease family protein [Bacteroidales bacterium]
MNLPFFIAKRYLAAKKSHNLINIISGISVIGVSIGAFALIVVLSVFNGFEQVISGLVNSVSPHLLIEPRLGKTIDTTLFPTGKIQSVMGVKALVGVTEEDALFRYDDKQHIGRIKGVGNAYESLGEFDKLMVQGSFVLSRDGFQFAVPGAGVSWYLGLNINNPSALVTVYVPKRGKASVMSFDQAFNSLGIQPIGVFSSQQDYDARYMIVPLEWANTLLGYENEVSAFEIYLTDNKYLGKVQKTVKQLLGNDYLVRDRFEQQETLYRIMRSEKWAIFIILTFILIMATFNVVGSLTMIIVDKRKDIAVLASLGAARQLIRKLFLTEGLLISLAGGVAGLVAGIIVVLIQQHFGLLKLGNEGGSFIIDAYPVDLHIMDVIAVFLTVFVIGLTSSAYTVFQSLKRMGDEKVVKG